MKASLAQAVWLDAKTSHRLMDVLTEGGVPARFVGGCVRDALLGQSPPNVDLDVATPLLPDQVIDRLESSGIKALPTGLKHGTITAVVEGRSFEITTLRKDVACDGRHAVVEFTDDFELDAARRDFTINAMSADRRGQLFDYFGGLEDLRVGKIRFVGDARLRVREDYLRILRYFRFYARYGRPPADRAALESCREAAPGLAQISGERIRSEVLKLLSATKAASALALMIEHDIISPIMSIDIDPSSLVRLVTLAPHSDALVRLAAVLRSSQDSPSALRAVSAWRFSNAQFSRLEQLTLEPSFTLPLTEADSRRLVYRLGEDTYRDLLALSAKTLDELNAALPIPKIPPFPLRGQDLIDRGVPTGPDLGQRLKQLEDWWLENDLQPDRNATIEELDRLLSDS